MLLPKAKLKGVLAGLFALAILAWTFSSATGQTTAALSIQGDHFALNGEAKFLVLAGYFDGLDAGNVGADLDYLKSKGIDGVRVFPNWWDYSNGNFTGNERTVIDRGGGVRANRLDKLKQIAETAASKGMIVDVSFTRETVTGACTNSRPGGGSLSVMCETQYKNGVASVAAALKDNANVFYDLQNEFDGDLTRLAPSHVTDLRNRIKAADADAIISVSTASQANSGSIAAGQAQSFSLDIANVHSTAEENANRIAAIVSSAKSAGKPVYLGEPYHTDYIDDNAATSSELVRFVTEAKRAGAAAFTFHFSGSFSLDGRSLQASLGSVEQGFLNSFQASLGQIAWGIAGTGGGGGGGARVISGIVPSSAQVGATVVIRGSNLSATVQIFNSAGARSTYLGSTNASATETQFTVPADLPAGNYTIKVGPTLTDVSNAFGFVVAGTGDGDGGGAATVIARKDLGAGVFPDVTFYMGRWWVAVQQDRLLNLYSFAADLTDQKTEVSWPYNEGLAFPRLTVHENILWLAYRSDNLGGDWVRLWRLDTGAVENLGGGFGNDPVAAGFGFVTWQMDGRVRRRLLTGGPGQAVCKAMPTGISRVLPSGNVKMVDEEKYLVDGHARPWLAGSLTVAERADRGVAGFFGNNYTAPVFSLWTDSETFTPHAASNGADLYAIATWSPRSSGDTVRLATVRWSGGEDGGGGSGGDGDEGGGGGDIPPTDLVCDPLPLDDLDALAECNFWSLLAPSDFYEPPAWENPATPINFSLTGTSGIGPAYNPDLNQVLIAAHTKAGSDDLVGGVFVSADDLSLIGPVFKIDQGPIDRFAGNPKAAYSPDDNKFLIAWIDERAGDNRAHVYGRFINPDGTGSGNDFAIVTEADVFLESLIYDANNKKFVVGFSEPPGKIALKTINAAGAVSAKILAADQFGWQGHSSLAYNDSLNEYWVTYIAILSGSDTAQEDNRAFLSRVNAATLQKVGQPLQLSETRIGRNAISYTQIAYSSSDAAALAVWMERGRQEGTGIFGKSISNDISLSAELEILTPNVEPSSDQFLSPALNFNPLTGTFFLSALDNNGGVMLVELDASGYVYEIKQQLSPPAVSITPWERIFSKLIKKVLAAAYGNFNPTNVGTANGAAVLASKNYESVVATNFQSAFAQSQTPPGVNPPGGPPPPIDASELGKLISQIYTWALAAASILALLMLVLGGYLYMTAGGNAQQSGKGASFILSAIVGLCLLFGSYLILKTINPDLVNFTVRTSR